MTVQLTILAATGGTTNPTAGVYQVESQEIIITPYASSGYVFSHWLLNGNVWEANRPNNAFAIVPYVDTTVQPVFTFIGNGVEPFNVMIVAAVVIIVAVIVVGLFVGKRRKK